MNPQELFERYKHFVKQNLLILALGLIGLIFFVYGLIWLFFDSKSASEDIVFESASQEISNSQKQTKNITVDVEGAVVSPGVYELPLDSRFKDALVAAGGLSSFANRDFVSKNLNLAIKLSDGAKIYIPLVGESTLDSKGVGSEGNISGFVGGQININSSSEQELDTLPGVGPVTAQKIINGRPYGSIDDLLNRKIVGSKVFDQIREKITAY